jgi:hypothetical protein
MAFTVTSASRRVAMAALLFLAICGAALRTWAPNPSTLRDVGSLLLVLWLPAVGNLIAYFIRKIPRRAPPATDFPPDAPFAPQLQVQLEVAGMPDELVAQLDGSERLCTVLVGRRGFRARAPEPLVRTFAAAGPRTLELQLLHPGIALRHLKPGAELHVLVGRTGVAKGLVLA